ncbi:MFS transporter [Actinomadura madurae]|uniref:MFS transporter n=1 Tax=Actinomadura madurae TaxID=1993 RepID=UPI0020D24EC0|nr:MFS transporter [Actinomadura madurae]MCQ0014678.1 MFS transporter [Actinomadura madurae]
MTATLDTAAPAAGTRTTETSRGGAPAPHPRRWLGLSAILAATLLNLLDSTVVNVAAPAIRADLGGSYSALQWMAAGYTLALAVALLTGGRLGDMFGRRPVLLAGAAGFLVTSTACALAWSPESLIAARVAQGLFAAVMIPQGFGLIRDLFGADTGKAFALFGPVIGLATILGPVVAGLLIDADLFGTGWRAIFLVNVPVGAYALVMGARVLPAPVTADRSGGLDATGMLLGGLGMSMLVYPLVQGRELGWPAWSLVLLAGSVPALALFAAHQLRRTRRGRTPLVRLSVFANRSYTSGILFVIVFFGTITGFSLATGLFLQLGLGYTPLAASLAMSSWAIGAFAGSAFSGMTMNSLGRRILHLGLALMTARPGRAVRGVRGGRDGARRLAPGGAAAAVRRRDGHDLRPAVRHHRGGHRRPRGRVRLGRAGVGAAARRVPRHRGARHGVLRGDRRPGGRALRRGGRAGRREAGDRPDRRPHRRRVPGRLPPPQPGPRPLSTLRPARRPPGRRVRRYGER